MMQTGTTRGGGGWMAVLYDAETMEPWGTGLVYHETREEAITEAREWAADEGIQFEGNVSQKATDS